MRRCNFPPRVHAADEMRTVLGWKALDQTLSPEEAKELEACRRIVDEWLDQTAPLPEEPITDARHTICLPPDRIRKQAVRQR